MFLLRPLLKSGRDFVFAGVFCFFFHAKSGSINTHRNGLVIFSIEAILVMIRATFKNQKAVALSRQISDKFKAIE